MDDKKSSLIDGQKNPLTFENERNKKVKPGCAISHAILLATWADGPCTPIWLNLHRLRPRLVFTSHKARLTLGHNLASSLRD